MSLKLALRFREQLSQVLQDEFDNILAGLQVQLGSLGDLQTIPTTSLVLTAESGKWVLTGTSYSGTRVVWALFGDLFWMSIAITRSTDTLGDTLNLKLPGNYRIKPDTYTRTVGELLTSSTGVSEGLSVYADGRVGPGTNPTILTFHRFSGAGAFSTTAGDLSIWAQILFPWSRT